MFDHAKTSQRIGRTLRTEKSLFCSTIVDRPVQFQKMVLLLLLLCPHARTHVKHARANERTTIDTINCRIIRVSMRPTAVHIKRERPLSACRIAAQKRNRGSDVTRKRAHKNHPSVARAPFPRLETERCTFLFFRPGKLSLSLSFIGVSRDSEPLQFLSFFSVAAEADGRRWREIRTFCE